MNFKAIIEGNLPELYVNCWLYDEADNKIYLGCRIEDHNCWAWAVKEGEVYMENNGISFDIVESDVYITHYLELPKIIKE